MLIRKGTVLMISLWILAILTVFALSIGYRAQLALKLTGHQKEHTKTSFLINTGINRAIYEIEKDDQTYDSLSDRWANNEKIFAKIYFDENNQKEFAKVSYLDGTNKEIFGLTDEESKININRSSQKVIKELLTQKAYGIDAKAVSEIINEWISSKQESAEEKQIFKNEYFAVKEELLLVLEYFFKDTQKAEEVYNNIKNLITVYGDGKININTVSPDILDIFVKALAETEAEKAIAESLTEDIIKLRENNGYFKSVAAMNQELSLDTEKLPLWNKLTPFLTVKSNYFRIEAKAYTAKVNKKAIAVFNRAEKKMAYWHGN